MPVDYDFPEDVLAAFGVSFVVARLRLTNGRSLTAWICGIVLLLFLWQAIEHYWWHDFGRG
jgi:hypothetical protein